MEAAPSFWHISLWKARTGRGENPPPPIRKTLLIQMFLFSQNERFMFNFTAYYAIFLMPVPLFGVILIATSWWIFWWDFLNMDESQLYSKCVVNHGELLYWDRMPVTLKSFSRYFHQKPQLQIENCQDTLQLWDFGSWDFSFAPSKP